MEAAYQEEETMAILDGCGRLAEARVSDGRDNNYSAVGLIRT
jgi:hypothetical protein